jgi:retron-type reverse transcriptase|nr:MAG TPA: group II intron reverse transcriptase/maturase [Caudoviricetes sp.]
MDYKYYGTLMDLNVLYDAFQQCKSGVDWKCSIQRYEANLFYNLNQLRKQLRDEKYKPDKFVKFDVNERGKIRHIKSPSIRDRVIQRAICDYILEPILYPKLIYDNGASVKGKGVDFTRKKLDKHLHEYYREYGNKGYILVGDFSKFFESIPHDKLIKALRKHVKDEKAMNLLKMIIYSFSGDEKGLGIGSQISQICGIFYPTPLDNYITCVQGCKFYARHMDDFYIISNDKEFLKNLLVEIDKIVSEELGMRLNDKKTQICRIDKGFNFLKQRIWLNKDGRITHKPIKKNITRERRKLKSFKKKLDNGEMNYKNDIEQQYKSWRKAQLKYNCKLKIHNTDKIYENLFKESEEYNDEWRKHEKRKSGSKVARAKVKTTS